MRHVIIKRHGDKTGGRIHQLAAIFAPVGDRPPEGFASSKAICRRFGCTRPNMHDCIRKSGGHVATWKHSTDPKAELWINVDDFRGQWLTRKKRNA